jgi:hypothetical protein
VSLTTLSSGAGRGAAAHVRSIVPPPHDGWLHSPQSSQRPLQSTAARRGVLSSPSPPRAGMKHGHSPSLALCVIFIPIPVAGGRGKVQPQRRDASGALAEQPPPRSGGAGGGGARGRGAARRGGRTGAGRLVAAHGLGEGAFDLVAQTGDYR